MKNYRMFTVALTFFHGISADVYRRTNTVITIPKSRKLAHDPKLIESTPDPSRIELLKNPIPMVLEHDTSSDSNTMAHATQTRTVDPKFSDSNLSFLSPSLVPSTTLSLLEHSKSSAPSFPLCTTSTPCSGVLTFFGMDPDCVLQECAGHCNTDSDCGVDLFCYQRNTDGLNNFVPGCETVPYDNINYCVANELMPSDSPSSEPSLKASVAPSSEPSLKASVGPSSSLSASPSAVPSASLSIFPPTSDPTGDSTEEPTPLTSSDSSDSFSPSKFDTKAPTILPSMFPTQCSRWTPLGTPLGSGIIKTYPHFVIASDRLVVSIREGNLVKVYKFDNESAWNQIGDSIDPGFASKSRYKLALSSHGDVIAIGDEDYDNSRGRVQIFATHPDKVWTQLGSAINGVDFYDQSGKSIAMSADGTTVAIGIYSGPGYVRVFSYHTRSEEWIQRGMDISGKGNEATLGWSIAISTNGFTIAIGAPYDQQDEDEGHVRIYKYNSTDWVQRGGDINEPGNSVAMSADGSIVAVGSPYSNAAGLIRVYKYNSTDWVQRGEDIGGETEEDRSGYSVAMSADGSVVMIGAPFNDGSYSNAGHLRVFKFNDIDRIWTQQGIDLDGEATYDVEMSADGNVIGTNGKNAIQIMTWTTCSTKPTLMPTIAPVCTGGKLPLQLELTTDRFPHQTTWIIQNLANETVFSGGPYGSMFTFHREIYCMNQDCYRFSIYDSSSDGLCCNWFTGNGNYKLFVDGAIIHEGGNFTLEESVLIGDRCPTSAPSFSLEPSTKPTLSNAPTFEPSAQPTSSMEPTGLPSMKPSLSIQPSIEPCKPGHFINSTSELRCQPCSPGSYQKEENRERCELCDVGSEQPNEGGTECIPCGKGTYQEERGQAKCKKCRSGGYCDTKLTGTCDGGFKPCRIGTYNNEQGRENKNACLPCRQGTFADKRDGLVDCIQCPFRLSSDGYIGNCTFCAENFYLNDTEVSSQKLFAAPDTYCKVCPSNAKCTANTTVRTLQITKGYWRDSNLSSTIYPCLSDKVCTGSTYNDSNFCRVDHKGPRCEVCSIDNSYFNPLEKKCVKCPPFTKMIISFTIVIAIIVTVGIFVTIGYNAIKSLHIDYISNKIACFGFQGKLKIVISFLQVISTLEHVYGARIHFKFKAWFNYLSLLCSFNLFDYIETPQKCFGSMKVQLILSSVWPFVLIAMLIMGMILCDIYSKKSKMYGSKLRKNIFLRSLHIAIVIIYLLLPSVSNNIFDAIRCESFRTDDITNEENSYLIKDWSLKCNTSDDEYKDVLATFWVLLVAWPCIMPLIFMGLLWYIRKAILSDRTTDVSEACRFLWRDYRKGMMFWEVLDIIRKIGLTGLIMFVDKEQGSGRLFRLLIAIAVSATYLGLLALARPYKRSNDLYLSFISNTLLLGCFLMGIVLNVCNWDDSCERFIGLLNSYRATLVAVVFTVGMLVISLSFIIVLSRTAVQNTTITVSGTRSRPNLEISENCHFHAFLSHVWSTGQDKTHQFSKMLHLHLPGVRVWLDVDELEYVSDLELIVEDSEVFILFYSIGYFKSPNCCREVSEAVAQAKPIIVLYADDGSNINTIQHECRRHFPQDKDPDEILRYIFNECPILWLGGNNSSFALASMKLVVHRLLQNLPYYVRNSAELNQGLQLGNKLDSSRLSYPRNVLFCRDNGQVISIINELREKITGNVTFTDDESLIASPALDTNNEVLLLYLNSDSFHDGSGKVSKLVEQSLEGGRKIILLWERDTNMGGYEIKHFISQTSQALLDLGLFDGIAVPLYTEADYRAISFHLLLKKMSGICCSD